MEMDELVERVAKVADKVGTPFGLISADNHHANGYRTAGREIAAAIRTGAATSTPPSEAPSA